MLPVAPNILREVQTCLSIGVIACVVSMSLTSPARGQLTQGANGLYYEAADNPSGTLVRTVNAFFGPETINLENYTFDGENLTNAGLTLDYGAAIMTYINYVENLEGISGTLIDPTGSSSPLVLGGVQTYKVGGVEVLGNFSSESLTEHYTGYIITQSGSTWYGDLSMNAGTTFTADNLVASTITTTSLTATTLTAGTLSVTGDATIGGTLDMSGNRITNVSDITTTSLNATSITAGTLSVTGNTTLGGTLNMSGNRITNVADGVNPTDAVNLRQLQQNQRESRAGIASVAAIAGIPTLSTTDDAVLGVGVGTFKGESSIAVGASKRFSDSTAIKFGVGANSSTGDVTGSFGIGIKW